jgi:hypothetical protein
MGSMASEVGRATQTAMAMNTSPVCRIPAWSTGSGCEIRKWS